MPSLALTLVFVAVGTIIWGFPGTWGLTALIPGFILGTTGAHLFRAVRKVHPLRPGVLALGLFLGGVAAFVSLALIASVSAPVERVIERTATIPVPKEIVWDYVGHADKRVAWALLVNDAELIGRGEQEAVGTAYRVQLNIDGAAADGEHTISAYELGTRVAWRVKFPAGVQVEDFEESIDLKESGGNTTITYKISYRVPSVLGRLFDRMRVRGMFDEAARMSVQALAAKASE